LGQQEGVFKTQAGIALVQNGEDADDALKHFKPINYGQDLQLADGLRAHFKDAGQVLSPAMIEVKHTDGDKTRRILFGGALGRSPRPLRRDPVQSFNVDYRLLESTNGDRLHGNDDPPGDLARVINGAIERDGALIIPSLAVRRTQTLLYAIRQLQEQGKVPTLPIFVDSPMACNATEAFKKHKGGYDLRAKTEEL
jgi:metallo-beta-lactamase family protein